MSAFVTVCGVLTKEPLAKIARSGKAYVTATLVEYDGDKDRWWWLTAFAPDTGDALRKLQASDAVRVSGKLQTSIYDKNKMEPRVNHAISDITTVELIGGPSFYKQQKIEVTKQIIGMIDVSEAPF